MSADACRAWSLGRSSSPSYRSSPPSPPPLRRRRSSAARCRAGPDAGHLLSVAGGDHHHHGQPGLVLRRNPRRPRPRPDRRALRDRRRRTDRRPRVTSPSSAATPCCRARRSPARPRSRSTRAWTCRPRRTGHPAAIWRSCASRPARRARPSSVIDASEAALWDVGAQLRITGWGYTTTDPEDATGYDVQRTLNWANVNRLSDDACASALRRRLRRRHDVLRARTHRRGHLPRRLRRADRLPDGLRRAARRTPRRGGSWASRPGAPAAATRAFPGVYARLGDAALRAFATDPDPVWSPVNVTAPTMPASATVGDVVTCTPGTWTGTT